MANTPKIVFGGVDGTGEFWNNNYERSFAQSHVNTLHNEWLDGPSHYRRGPWWIGDWTRVEANRIYNAVKGDWKNGAQAVFLAGYSRGGAAVIEVAKWLKADNIPVECLILFDPVDRSRTVGENWNWGDTPIVDTVKTVIYAQRASWTKSRESFGNCGKILQDPAKTTKYHETFWATHGGLGGTPWTEPEEGFIDEGFPDFDTHVTVADDKKGSEQVKNWVFKLVYEMLFQCIERLSPANQTQPSTGTPVSQPANGKRIHVVKTGDWLSKIAQTYYGDINKWKTIYDANKTIIGNNPDLILPGMRLVIP